MKFSKIFKSLINNKRGLAKVDYILIFGMLTLASLGASTVIVHTSEGYSLNDMTYRVKDDISYVKSLTAQMFKMGDADVTLENRGELRYRIDFSNTNYEVCSGFNKYAIVVDEDGNGVYGENPNSNGFIESALDPIMRKDFFCVNMNEGIYGGFAVDVDFDSRPGSTSKILEFDVGSSPYFVDENGTSIKITGPIEIEVTDGQAYQTILLKHRIGSTTVL